jgi:hypothetical protein
MADPQAVKNPASAFVDGYRTAEGGSFLVQSDDPIWSSVESAKDDSLEFVFIGRSLNDTGDRYALALGEAYKKVRPGGTLAMIMPKFEPLVGLEWTKEIAVERFMAVTGIAMPSVLQDPDGGFVVYGTKPGDPAKAAAKAPVVNQQGRGGRGGRQPPVVASPPLSPQTPLVEVVTGAPASPESPAPVVDASKSSGDATA